MFNVGLMCQDRLLVASGNLGVSGDQQMIGNCLCWALIFKLFYGGEMRSAHMAGKCRTWYVVRKDGSTIMFKRTHFFLPKPIREWLYLGKIISNAKDVQPGTVTRKKTPEKTTPILAVKAKTDHTG